MVEKICEPHGKRTAFTASLFGANLPNDWRLVPVGEVLTNSQYGLSEPVSSNGSTPIVGMRDISNGTVNLTDLPSIDDTGHDWSSMRLKAGDVLLNRTNSPDLVGKVGIVREDSEAVFASYLVRLVVDRQMAEPEFVNYWLNTPIAQRALKRLSTRGVSQANINPTEFRRHCPLPLAPLPEQRKIAEILRSWDETIEKLETETTIKKQIHNGYVKRLINYSQCKKRRLRDHLQQISNRNSEQKIERVLSVTNSAGFVLAEDQFAHRIASADLSNYNVVQRGQYAYNPARINVGSIARLDRWTDGVLSPMYVVFQVKPSLDSDFFYHWLFSAEARQRIRLAAQGSVRETVSFDDLGSISLPLPSLDHQRAVAWFLNESQREIGLLHKLIQKYQHQKRGLMQKLLTGKWRVRV